MALSRKHYQDLAIITGHVGATCTEAGRQLHNDLADWLQVDNPRFDRARFTAAVNRTYRKANDYTDESIVLVGEGD